MQKKRSPFLRVEDHFGEVRQTPIITVFENRLPEAPRFTIAIPTYRRPDTLRETLESAVNQDTTEQYEIVVSDNNPERNDETESLMAEYADVPNLTYIKNSQNLGMTGNWNRLALLTRGEYMVLLHDDDCIAPFFLSSASTLLEQHPDADLLQFSKIHENKFEFNPKDLLTRRIRLCDNIEHNIVQAPTGTIYRCEILKELGGWNNEFYPSHDYCFDNLLLLHGYEVYKSPLRATFYRIGINASLKKETKVGIIHIDTGLRDALLRHLGFPGFLRRPYLELRNENIMAQWDLSAVDVESIEIGRYSLTSKRIASILLYRYIKIIRRIVHLIG